MTGVTPTTLLTFGLAGTGAIGAAYATVRTSLGNQTIQLLQVNNAAQADRIKELEAHLTEQTTRVRERQTEVESLRERIKTLTEVVTQAPEIRALTAMLQERTERFNVIETKLTEVLQLLQKRDLDG